MGRTGCRSSWAVDACRKSNSDLDASGPDIRTPSPSIPSPSGSRSWSKVTFLLHRCSICAWRWSIRGRRCSIRGRKSGKASPAPSSPFSVSSSEEIDPGSPMEPSKTQTLPCTRRQAGAVQEQLRVQWNPSVTFSRRRSPAAPPTSPGCPPRTRRPRSF